MNGGNVGPESRSPSIAHADDGVVSLRAIIPDGFPEVPGKRPRSLPRDLSSMARGFIIGPHEAKK